MIKVFRGKNKRTGLWVVGNYLGMDGSYILHGSSDEGFIAERVFSETVGQWIGADECGARIFEGDIITSSDFPNRKFLVEFDPSIMQFVGIDLDKPTRTFVTLDKTKMRGVIRFKKIGNFYDGMQDQQPIIVDAEFISVWDGGTQIVTPCKVNLSTREIIDIGVLDCQESVDSPDEEWVRIGGKDYEAIPKDEHDFSGFGKFAEFWYD